MRIPLSVSDFKNKRLKHSAKKLISIWPTSDKPTLMQAMEYVAKLFGYSSLREAKRLQIPDDLLSVGDHVSHYSVISDIEWKLYKYCGFPFFQSWSTYDLDIGIVNLDFYKLMKGHKPKTRNQEREDYDSFGSYNLPDWLKDASKFPQYSHLVFADNTYYTMDGLLDQISALSPEMLAEFGVTSPLTVNTVPEAFSQFVAEELVPKATCQLLSRFIPGQIIGDGFQRIPLILSGEVVGACILGYMGVFPKIYPPDIDDETICQDVINLILGRCPSYDHFNIATHLDGGSYIASLDKTIADLPLNLPVKIAGGKITLDLSESLEPGVISFLPVNWISKTLSFGIADSSYSLPMVKLTSSDCGNYWIAAPDIIDHLLQDQSYLAQAINEFTGFQGVPSMQELDNAVLAALRVRRAPNDLSDLSGFLHWEQLIRYYCENENPERYAALIHECTALVNKLKASSVILATLDAEVLVVLSLSLLGGYERFLNEDDELVQLPHRLLMLIVFLLKVRPSDHKALIDGLTKEGKIEEIFSYFNQPGLSLSDGIRKINSAASLKSSIGRQIENAKEYKMQKYTLSTDKIFGQHYYLAKTLEERFYWF